MDSTNVMKKRATELHLSQSPHQKKLLTEPSDFKRFPKPQGWTVTVNHENLTHSSRVVSCLLQPLSITRGQSEAVPGCICVWLLYWEIVCFDLHMSATAVGRFHASCCLYPVQFQWGNTVVKQSRICYTMFWPSFILSFPRVPSHRGVFMSWTWLSLAKCDCSVHKPMWP